MVAQSRVQTICRHAWVPTQEAPLMAHALVLGTPKAGPACAQCATWQDTRGVCSCGSAASRPAAPRRSNGRGGGRRAHARLVRLALIVLPARRAAKAGGDAWLRARGVQAAAGAVGPAVLAGCALAQLSIVEKA